LQINFVFNGRFKYARTVLRCLVIFFFTKDERIILLIS
jgi:hypothetical protein